MVLSPSLIRRYTPPTCTLEIKAKTSPLSQWMLRPVIKELDFKLRFDDPRLVDQDKITIMGDRTQLETLYEVVSNYVQKFLQNEQNELPLAPDNQITTLQNVTVTSAIATAPSLQPEGLLSHRLHFGSLANSTSGEAIKLSAVQLCDLTDALDDYAKELLTLPGLNQKTVKHSPQQWSAIAASFLIGVGLTSATAILFYQNQQLKQSVATLNQAESAPKQALELPIVPPVPQNLPQPTVKPFPKPTLPDTLANAKKLPPPASVTPPPPPTLSNSPTKKSSESKIIVTPPPAAQPPSAPVTNNIPVSPQTLALPPLTNAPVAKTQASQPSVNNTQPSIAARTGDNAGNIASDEQSKEPVNSKEQLVQIKTYFEENWKPPAKIAEVIEYRLEINQNGAVEKIIPLGRASEFYLTKVKMPEIGATFVSPNIEVEKPLIRVVLEPNGKVKTLIESDSP